jgi:hypothetical protein
VVSEETYKRRKEDKNLSKNKEYRQLIKWVFGIYYLEIHRERRKDT